MASDLPLPGLPRHECANLIKESFLSVFEVMVARPVAQNHSSLVARVEGPAIGRQFGVDRY